MTIQEKLRTAVEKSGLTQRDAAKYLGISLSLLEKKLSGARAVRACELAALEYWTKNRRWK